MNDTSWEYVSQLYANNDFCLHTCICTILYCKVNLSISQKQGVRIREEVMTDLPERRRAVEVGCHIILIDMISGTQV